jgi:short-subunit dehydrogenase
MEFSGRCAWITGASSGIGEAVALGLAGRGMKLIISARRADRLKALAAKCPRPHEIHVLPLDVADEAAAETAVKEAEKVFGGVDLIFHSAGVTQRSMAVDTQLDTVRRIMEINFFATVNITQRLLPGMLARGSGHVAVVSSLAGHVGTPRRSSYSASKHALQGYFDSLRAEVHDLGLRVSVFCPGWITTDLAQSALTGDGRAYAKPSHVHGKKGLSPEACADQMIKALEKDTSEVLIGGGELAAAYLKRAAPSVLARVLRRIKTS